MIIWRNYRLFSDKKVDDMIDKLVDKLDKAGVYDYEIVDRIQKDVISINSDLNNIRIYIPLEFEYSQFDIDDYVRDIVPFSRPVTTLDRNIYIMKIPTKLDFNQYFKLIKFIVENEEFCSIIKEN